MTVLFVCTGNRFRSLGAEAFFKAKNPEAEAFSRGTEPSRPISNAVKKELEERNVAEEAVYRPEKISEEDLERADLVVAMTSRHVEYIEENFDTETDIVTWDIPDVDADQPDEELREKVSSTYDTLEKKVEEL